MLFGRPWPVPGETVHYTPPIEGATGGGEFALAVIRSLGDRAALEDIFAELVTEAGEPVSARSMLYAAFGHWDADGPAAHCGGTWHPVWKCGRVA